MHSLPPPFLAPRPSKNSNICIQHGSHTFFWKSYSAHSQGEAKYKMYCSHLSAFLSSLFNLFGHLHRGAQSFLITVILKDILLEKLATASTNSPSLWPGSLYCLLPFAILCNGEYDNILISCSKWNKTKQNKTKNLLAWLECILHQWKLEICLHFMVITIHIIKYTGSIATNSTEGICSFREQPCWGGEVRGRKSNWILDLGVCEDTF